MKFVLCFVPILWATTSALKLPEDMVYLAETMNPEVDEHGNKFFEGDMILNKKQEKVIESEFKSRAGESDPNSRWPRKTIVYKIATELANVSNIKTAIQNWRDNTCVRFRVAKSNNRAYARFQLGLGGCNSNVGYQGRVQRINLGENCHGLGTIEHEIGHALGVYHEQSRHDRDFYVTVLKANLNLTFENNFEVAQTSSSYNIPYDLDSVMHYGPEGFAINQENTLVTNNPFNHFRIGQRNGMSFDDIKLVNIMYKCSEKCVRRPFCHNDGFVNKKCKCVCPLGTNGINCEHGQRSFPVNPCQYNLFRANRISSPGFPNSKKKAKCVWRITAPRGQRVSITFRKFDVRPPIDSGDCKRCWKIANWCYFDYLELRLKDQINGRKYCGTQLLQRTRTSTGNVAVLVFRRNNLNFQGFQADVRFI